MSMAPGGGTSQAGRHLAMRECRPDVRSEPTAAGGQRPAAFQIAQRYHRRLLKLGFP